MILLYVHALAATGVVRNARLIAAALRARGHEVRLLTALPGGEGVEGVEHRALLPAAMPSRAAEKIRAIHALRDYLKQGGADLLISAGNHGHGTVWAASRGMKRPPRVYRISNDLERGAPGTPGGRMAAMARRLTARIVAADAARLVLVSPSLSGTGAFRAASAAGRVEVIPNGIDAAAARMRAVGPVPHPWLGGPVPVVLAIGRLAPQKNFETLLHGFARLRARRPARLILLGESRDRARQRLIGQASALGVAADVALPGVVDNVFPWLAGANAFILPSWWEGSANVLLEAMAVNIPCVASRSAGNAPLLLDGGRHGLLVDPRDPAEMADALALQIDPATAIRPGARIDAFTLDAMTDGWIALVERLTAR